MVLKRYGPFADSSRKASCLEVASGTGQHVAHMARTFPHVTFQPTEYAGGSSGPEAAAYDSLSPVFASSQQRGGFEPCCFELQLTRLKAAE